MKPPFRLHRLGERIPGTGAAAATLARLAGAWNRLLGPALAARLRPLAVRRGVLVAGCADPAYLSSLRDSAQAAWPELRERIRRLTGITLAGLRIEPCDEAPPTPPPVAASDPLAEVLRRYRAYRKEPLDSRRQ